jgi:hypothetical protein
MQFIITIDTEGDNQWDPSLPDSTENIRFIPRFQDLCDRHGFPPTYLCTYDVVAAAAFDQVLAPLHSSGRAEIGAHLHPWTTPPLTPWDRSDRSAAYPSELPPGVFARKLETLTNLIADKTGRRPRSYRAGRWGLSAAHIPVLLELGYLADCSVTPMLNWTDPGARERGQDFSIAQARPYFMAWGDPAREGASGLLEVPVTILNTNGWMRRSAALRALYTRYRRTAVARALNRAFLVAPRWFRPFSDMTVDRMRAVFDTARTLGLPVIEMMFHSSELMPNGSPHNLTDAAVDNLHARLDQTFAFLAREGVMGITLGDYAESVRLAPSPAIARESLQCTSEDLTWVPSARRTPTGQ